MAITMWVGSNAGGGGNSLFASQDLGSALVPFGQAGAAGPASGAWLYGFIDSEQRARTFYSSSSNTIALPTLVAPPVAPLNFVGCGTSATNGVVYQLVQTGADYGASVQGNGPYLVTLSFTAGSPDSASPFQFTLDAGAILIVSDQQYQGA